MLLLRHDSSSRSLICVSSHCYVLSAQNTKLFGDLFSEVLREVEFQAMGGASGDVAMLRVREDSMSVRVMETSVCVRGHGDLSLCEGGKVQFVVMSVYVVLGDGWGVLVKHHWARENRPGHRAYE